MKPIIKDKTKKLCLVCSSGGHFLQLYSLGKFWRQYPRFWVTFDKTDTHYFLKNEKVYWAFYPTTRNLWNFFRNLFLAFKIFFKEKPDVIISTGAGVVVPFVIVGKLFRNKIIYLESLSRIKNLSLSGKIIYFFTDNFLVQWPQLARKYKKAEYKGKII